MTNVESNQAGILFLRRDKPSKVLSRKIFDFFRKSDRKSDTRSLGGAEDYLYDDYRNPRTEFVASGDNSFHENGSDNGATNMIPAQQLKEYLWKYVILEDRQGIISALHHGADVDAKFGDYGQTVLHEAGRRGHHKTCELLVRAGADPNEQDDMGFTPLHLAIQFGRKEAVKTLLRYCSSVEIKNVYGDSAIHIASRFNHKSLIPIILEKPLSTPLKHLHDKKSKSAPDLRSFQGRHSPLNEFLRRDRVTFSGIPSTSSGSSTSSVSGSMADVNMECCHHRVDLRNENGDTGLHIASALNHKSTAKKLLQYGASTHIKNDQGSTPLELAVSKNNGTIIRLLRNPPKVIMLLTDRHSPNVRVGHRQTLTLPRDLIIKKDCKPGCGFLSTQSKENESKTISLGTSKFYVHRSTSPMCSASSDSSVCSCFKENSSGAIITTTEGSDKSLSLEERIRLSLYGSSNGSHSVLIHREASDYSDKDRDFSIQTIRPTIFDSSLYIDPSEKTRIVEIDPQPNNTYDDDSSSSLSTAKQSSIGSSTSKAQRSTSRSSKEDCSTCSKTKNGGTDVTDFKCYVGHERSCCRNCHCHTSSACQLRDSFVGCSNGCCKCKCAPHHCQGKLLYLTSGCSSSSLGNLVSHPALSPSPLCEKPVDAKKEVEETSFSSTSESRQTKKEVIILEEQIKSKTTTTSHKECCHHCSNCHHFFLDSSTASSQSNSSKTNVEVDDQANKFSSDLNNRIQVLGESIREKLELLNTKYAQLECQEDKLKKIITEKDSLQTNLKRIPTLRWSDDSYILPGGSRERGIDVFMDDYSQKNMNIPSSLHPSHVSPKIKDLQDRIQKSQSN